MNHAVTRCITVEVDGDWARVMWSGESDPTPEDIAAIEELVRSLRASVKP